MSHPADSADATHVESACDDPTPTARPGLCWDAEDELFDNLAARLRHQVGEQLEYRPHSGLRSLEASPDPRSSERLFHGISLERPEQTRLFGVAAILCARTYGGTGLFAWWCYRNVPGCAPVLDALGQVASNHSRGVARLGRWLHGNYRAPAHFRLTRWLCLRLIALSALCAFLSLYAQLDGLIGEHGISPAADFMGRVDAYAERMEQRHDARAARPARGEHPSASNSASNSDDGWEPLERYLRVPTLLWIDASDDTLQWLALLGVFLSLLLLFDIAPGPMLLGCWVLYLSLITAGGTFFMYQWDILLLEALLVAMFFAPWRRIRPRLRSDRAPTGAGLWAVRLLVFKLMLLSGLVKYMADDPTWEQWTALEYHFFTQPIPSFTAYYAHHVPDGLLSAATGIMLGIELILPIFMIVGPRRLRLLAGAGTILLMLGIGATGNYGFFNLLTAALAISLLDDAFLMRCGQIGQIALRPFGGAMRALGARLGAQLSTRDSQSRAPGRIARILGWVLLIPLLWTSGARSCQRVDREYQPGETSAWLLEQTRSLHSVNSYGLFARMTTTRPEIVLEGSRDGIAWQTYHFHYKPTALDDRPSIIGPHMPRLDWQMWFAALRGCQRATWFHNFMLRLLEGRSAVRGLLKSDPFGDQPPRYLRSTTYNYTFAELGTDNWWRRERVGPFCPMVTIENGQLVGVSPGRR